MYISVLLPAQGVLADEIYSTNTYGTCPYQQNCPTTSTTSAPPTTTQTTTSGGPPPSSVPPTTSTSSINPGPSGTNPPGPSSSGGGTTQNSPSGSSGSGLSGLSKQFTTNLGDSVLGRFWQDRPWFLPFLLFILLLVMALILTVQAGIEHRNVIRLRKTYERLAALQEEVRTFLQLLQHNLRLPVATMNMALELLINNGVTKAKLVYELLTSMSSDVEQLTSSNVQDLEAAPAVQARLDEVHVTIAETIQSKLFWGPMVGVLILVVAYDVLTYAVFPYSFSLQLALLEMGVIFGGVLVLMNSVGYLRRSKQRKFLLDEIRTEFTELERHRASVVDVITSKLQQDFSLVASAIDALPPSHETLLVQSGESQMKLLLEKLAIVKQVQDPTFFSAVTPTAYKLEGELKLIIERIRVTMPRREIMLDTNGLQQKTGMGYVGPIDFVLAGVIDNAARHGIAAERVLVQARTRGQDFEVIVTNSTDTLTTKNVEQLFRPFSRVGDVLEYNQGGAGMGLFVSRLIIERLGGAISLQLIKPQTLVCTVRFPAHVEVPVSNVH